MPIPIRWWPRWPRALPCRREGWASAGDGRDDSGEPAEPGRYRVRVELAQEGRTYTFADRIKLVPPEQVPGFKPEAAETDQQQRQSGGRGPEKR